MPDLSKEAVKWDDTKPRLDLVPPGPIVDIAQVFTFGATKYRDRNWELGFKYGRIYAAIQRHLLAWWDGEDIDPETGLSHLAHAGCDMLMLLEFTLHSGVGVDDRPHVQRQPAAGDE